MATLMVFYQPRYDLPVANLTLRKLALNLGINSLFGATTAGSEPRLQLFLKVPHCAERRHLDLVIRKTSIQNCRDLTLGVLLVSDGHSCTCVPVARSIL